MSVTQELLDRVGRLEQRVFELETRLGPEPQLLSEERPAARQAVPILAAAPMSPPPAVASAPTMAAAALSPVVTPPPIPPVPAVARAPVAAASAWTPIVAVPAVPPPLTAKTVAAAQAALTEPRATPGASSPAVALSYSPRPAPAPVAQGQLEQTIGLKWAGWIGALVLVIGAGLGIHYAYQNHWFELIPPAARLVLMSLAGFALLAAGEVVLRRVNSAAAAALYGAGIAILVFVSHAGHAYYRLYQRETAFVFMAGTAVIGAAVAMRGRMLSTAVLALIGGSLAPLVLKGDANLLVPFLSYLLMLQIVAVTVAWWGGSRRWWTLRGLSMASLGIWILSIVVPGTPSLAPALFALLYWIVYHAEMIVSGWSADRRRAAESGADAAPPEGSAIFSALATGGLLAVCLASKGLDSPDTHGLLCAGLAGLCAFLAVGLRRPARPHLEWLSTSLGIQAAGLLVLAVPLAFDGVNVSVAWAGLALAFAIVTARKDVPYGSVAALGTWLLAALSLIGWGLTSEHDSPRWLEALSLPVAPLLWLGWALAIVGHIIAWLLHSSCAQRTDDPNPIYVARFASAMASVLFAVVTVHSLSPVAATFALVAYAWAMALADRLDPPLKLLMHSAAALAVALSKWVVVDTLVDRFAPDWVASQSQVLLNPTMAAGTAIAASLVALGWLRRRDWLALAGRSDQPAGSAAIRLGMASAVIAIFTFGLTMEVDRVIEQARLAGAISAWQPTQFKLLGLTVLWSLASMARAGLARLMLPAEARRMSMNVALVLMVMLAGKFVLIDTLGWRTLRAPADVAAFANAQVLAALVVAGGLVALAAGLLGTLTPQNRGVASAAVLALLTYAASLEIDRFFEHASPGWIANPPLAKQVVLSMFWGLLAIGWIVGGFAWRRRGLRYAGLALFALTLLKVVLVDMSDAQTGYRILSFVALGLLLLGTSVLYGKVGGMIEARPSDAGPAQA